MAKIKVYPSQQEKIIDGEVQKMKSEKKWL